MKLINLDRSLNLLLLLIVTFLTGCSNTHRPAERVSWLQHWREANSKWRGVHLWVDNEASAKELITTLPALSAAGANVVIIEVNYCFEFQTHPELRNDRFVTTATAHQLAHTARACGIRLIPQFNCLGHQSFGHRIEPLLKVHPNFNETPSLNPRSPGMYCLSWCPRAEGLDKIIFSLIDEMADGFEADAFHIGMDEVYLIGSDECPRCKGADPASLFADQANRLNRHLKQKNLEVLMWADRPIGPKLQGYSKYDNAKNDLSASIHLIDKQIVMCDWHYEWKKTYPSIAFLSENGFRVLPSGFLPLKAAQAFSDFARLQSSSSVIGYLATTWNETRITNSPTWPPIKEILPQWR